MYASTYASTHLESLRVREASLGGPCVMRHGRSRIHLEHAQLEAATAAAATACAARVARAAPAAPAAPA
eukprot:scaffold78983_cov75-Phaeocystis_antarctica.AAC.1